jgi:gas vesicle protein
VKIPFRRHESFHPSQFFGIGMTVGVLVGFVVGSVLALRLGDETLEAVKDLVDRFAGRNERVNFELLLQ